MTPPSEPNMLRRVLITVVTLNLAYCAIEAVVAWRIGSVSLFADAVDFLEDATINALVLVALAHGSRLRAGVAMGLAAVIQMPGLAALWTAYEKLVTQVPPDAVSLSITGAGALAVNIVCALLLARMRRAAGSLMRAAFLSARNDVISNVAIIGAGAATGATFSIWPDLTVGVAIALINAQAAHVVYVKARQEWREAKEAATDDAASHGR
jgi:Co/Zn/Cd efflux system component